jgi:hypothetical protein
MTQKVLGFFMVFLFLFWSSLGQSDLTGTLQLRGAQTVEGVFNQSIDKNTSSLIFTDNSGKRYNVLSYDGALAYYKSSNTFYRAFLEEKGAEMLEVMVLGDARLYKSLKTQKLYVENVKLNTGIVELVQASDLKTNKVNRGRLLVVFKDCQSVRERTYDSDLKLNSIKLLVNAYNSCADINEDYQFTNDEQRAQQYADEKTMITFDIGAGYYSIKSDIAVLTEDRDYFDSDQSGGFSLYASLNISPNYFYGYTGKIFADISLQYNFQSDLAFDEVSQSVSNLNLMFTPKFYFGTTSSNFRPFLGFGVGLSAIFMDIEDLADSRFPETSDTAIKFIYGPQFGFLLFNKVEVSADIFPYFSRDLFFDRNEVKVESTFSSFTIKLGYNF